MAANINNTNRTNGNKNEMKHETKLTNPSNNNTVIVSKIVLDFDDALFPSNRYKVHEILKYHESTSSEPVQTGRECFKDKEPSFVQLKKDIDLICFKLMQRYNKENFVILSTGDYRWIESTLSYYQYLLSAYNIEIYSTQEWAKKHPNEFNISGSLSQKSFLMKMLLNKWRNEEQLKYGENVTVKIRLISIGDSFFEFLACYNIGFDYVNRIKLLEEPSVNQMITLWSHVLYLCSEDVYNANIVFVDDNEYFELDDQRMKQLNEQCIERVNNTNTVFNCSLLDIITVENAECFEIVTDENGKQHKHRKQKTMNVLNVPQCTTQKVQTLSDEKKTESYHMYKVQGAYTTTHYNNTVSHNPFVPLSAIQQPPINQQLLYAQQLWLQQQQEMQSQFLLDVPQMSQYSNLNYSNAYASYGQMHDMHSNTIISSNYTSNTW